MSEEIDRFECSFRFLNLSENEAVVCASLFQTNRLPRQNLKKTGYVVAIPVLDSKVCDQIASYISHHNVTKDQYDVCLGIRTDYDSRIYGVPAFVSKLIRETTTEITVSFTYTDPV